jgi:tetratricopeptide (TPR) repeat protein
MAADDFPFLANPALAKLSEDLARHAQSRPLSEPEAIVQRLGSLLVEGSASNLKRVINLLSDTFARTTSPLDRFLEVDGVVSLAKLRLADLLSDIASAAFQCGEGLACAKCFATISKATKLDVTRFLAAWAFLNISEYESCIWECEQVTTPNSSVYALLGQAFLESGQANQAIEALRVATTLDAREPIAWFFLAKANFTASNHVQAWRACENLRELETDSVEVDLLQGIIAVEMGQEFCAKSFDYLARNLSAYSTNPDVIVTLFRLAIGADNRHGFAHVTNSVDLSPMMRSKPFIQQLPIVLRQLNELAWHTELNGLLAGLTMAA